MTIYTFVVRVCMMSICAIDPHGTAWTTWTVTTSCNNCIQQCHCKHLMFLCVPHGHCSSIFLKCTVPHIGTRTHMGSNDVYGKTKRQIYSYTWESNGEQMMCISGYIVRWSKQKTSILIIMTLRLQALNNDFLHMLSNYCILPFTDQLVHFSICMEVWVTANQWVTFSTLPLLHSITISVFLESPNCNMVHDGHTQSGVN